MKNMQIFYKNLMQYSIDNLSENILSINPQHGIKDTHSERLYEYYLGKIAQANHEQLVSLKGLLRASEWPNWFGEDDTDEAYKYRF